MSVASLLLTTRGIRKMKISVSVVEDEASLKKVFDIREEVFVVGQNVSREEEFDEFEDTSVHFLATDEEGTPLGTARWREAKDGIKLERFAVLGLARGKGVGTLLVAAALKDIESRKGRGNLLYMHAQLTAVPLYKKFDFEEVGEQFLECDIWHVTMQKQI